jgi:hypothetical protein
VVGLPNSANTGFFLKKCLKFEFFFKGHSHVCMNDPGFGHFQT